MFRWLRRLLGLTNYQDPFIFHYHDGTRTRSADPIAVERSLIDSLGEDWISKVIEMDKPLPLGAMGEFAIQIENTREALRKDVMLAICRAFRVEPYNDHDGASPPTGLIEPMIRGLLTGFMLFSRDLVEAARPFRSAQSRASPSPGPQPPSSGQESTSPATESPPNVSNLSPQPL